MENVIKVVIFLLTLMMVIIIKQFNEIRFLQLSQSRLVIENIEQTLLSPALLLCKLFFSVFVNYAFQDMLNSVEDVYTTM